MLRISNELYHWLIQLDILTRHPEDKRINDSYEQLDKNIIDAFLQNGLLLDLTNKLCKIRTMNNLVINLTRFHRSGSRAAKIINAKLLQKQLKQMGVQLSDEQKQNLIENDISILAYVLEKLYHLFNFCGDHEELPLHNLANKIASSNKKKDYSLNLPELSVNNSSIDANENVRGNFQSADKNIKNSKSNYSIKKTVFHSAHKTSNMKINKPSFNSAIKNIPMKKSVYSNHYTIKSEEKSKLFNSEKHNLALLRAKQEKYDLYVQLEKTQVKSKLNQISDTHINKEYIISHGNYINYKKLKKDEDPNNSENLFETLLILLAKVFNTKPIDSIDFFIENNKLFEDFCIKGEELHNYKRMILFFEELNKLKLKIFQHIIDDKAQLNVNMLLSLTKCTLKSDNLELLKLALEFSIDLINELKRREKLFYVQVYFHNNPDHAKELMLAIKNKPEIENMVFDLIALTCNKLFPYHKFFEILKLNSNRSEELRYQLQLLKYLILKSKKRLDSETCDNKISSQQLTDNIELEYNQIETNHNLGMKENAIFNDNKDNSIEIGLNEFNLEHDSLIDKKQKVLSNNSSKINKENYPSGKINENPCQNIKNNEYGNDGIKIFSEKMNAFGIIKMKTNLYLEHIKFIKSDEYINSNHNFENRRYRSDILDYGNRLINISRKNLLHRNGAFRNQSNIINNNEDISESDIYKEIKDIIKITILNKVLGDDIRYIKKKEIMDKEILPFNESTQAIVDFKLDDNTTPKKSHFVRIETDESHKNQKLNDNMRKSHRKTIENGIKVSLKSNIKEFDDKTCKNYLFDEKVRLLDLNNFNNTSVISNIEKEYVMNDFIDIDLFLKNNPELLDYIFNTSTSTFFSFDGIAKNSTTHSSLSDNLNFKDYINAVKIIDILLTENLIKSKPIIKAYIEKLFHIVYDYKKEINDKNNVKTHIRKTFELADKFVLQNQIINLYINLKNRNYDVQNQIENLLSKLLLTNNSTIQILKDHIVSMFFHYEDIFEDFLTNKFLNNFTAFLNTIADKKIYLGDFVIKLIKLYFFSKKIKWKKNIKLLEAIIRVFKKVIEYNECLYSEILDFLEINQKDEILYLYTFRIVSELLSNIFDIEKRIYHQKEIFKTEKIDRKKVMLNRDLHFRALFTEMVKEIIQFSVDPVRQSILLVTLYYNSQFKNFIHDKNEGHKVLPNCLAFSSIISFYGDIDQIIQKLELETEFEVNQLGVLDIKNLTLENLWIFIDKKRRPNKNMFYNTNVDMLKHKMFELALKKGVKADPRIIKHLEDLEKQNKIKASETDKLLDDQKLNKTKMVMYKKVQEISKKVFDQPLPFYFLHISETEAKLLDDTFAKYERFFKELFSYYAKFSILSDKNFNFNEAPNNSKTLFKEQLAYLKILKEENDYSSKHKNEALNYDIEEPKFTINNPINFSKMLKSTDELYWIYDTILRFGRDIECIDKFEAIPLKIFLNKLKTLDGKKQSTNYYLYDTYKGIIAQTIFMTFSENNVITELSIMNLLVHIKEKNIGNINWHRFINISN